MLNLTQMILVMGCVPGLYACKMPLNVGVYRTIQACKSSKEPNLVSKICAQAQKKTANESMPVPPAGIKLSHEKESQEERDKKICEENTAFAQDSAGVMQKKTAGMIAEIDAMPQGSEKDYWIKILDAYNKLDIDGLERLQNDKDKPRGAAAQTKILFFILSAIEQDQSECITSGVEKPEPITLLPMSLVKKSSFFKQITAPE